MTFESQAGSFVGKIEKFDLHNDKWNRYDVNDIGILSIYIEGMPKSCNQETGLNRVVITSDHALFNVVFSTVLTAKAMDRKLYVNYLNSCKTRDKAWDFGFIGLK